MPNLGLQAHGCVTAVFSGHDHAGGYAFRNGVHHVTFPSPLNVKEEDPRAHATVEVFDDKIVVKPPPPPSAPRPPGLPATRHSHFDPESLCPLVRPPVQSSLNRMSP